LNSKDDYALNQLAWLLATCADASVRHGRAAVEEAKKACALAAWKNNNYIDTLAAACAEAGIFEQAVKFEKQAMEMAPFGAKIDSSGSNDSFCTRIAFPTTKHPNNRKNLNSDRLLEQIVTTHGRWWRAWTAESGEIAWRKNGARAHPSF